MLFNIIGNNQYWTCTLLNTKTIFQPLHDVSTALHEHLTILFQSELTWTKSKGTWGMKVRNLKFNKWNKIVFDDILKFHTREYTGYTSR